MTRSDIWVEQCLKVCLCVPGMCAHFGIAYCILWLLAKVFEVHNFHLHISEDQLEMSPYQSFPDATGSGRRVSQQELFS